MVRYFFWLLIAVGCTHDRLPTAERSEAPDPSSPQDEAPENNEASVDGSCSPQPGDTTGDGRWRYLIPPAPVTMIDRSAALPPDRVVAVGEGSLYRLATDHWEMAALPEGTNLEAVDVVAAGSWFWVLLRDREDQRQLVVLCWDGRTTFRERARAAIDVETLPRALAVLPGPRFLIGGRLPDLTFVDGRRATPLASPSGPVQSFRPRANGQVIATHEDGSTSTITPGGTDSPSIGSPMAAPLHKLRGDRGILTEIMADGVVKLEGGHSSVASPIHGPSKLLGETSEGLPVAITDRGNLYVWRRNRTDFVCGPSDDGEAHGMFEVDLGPGWVGMGGAGVREPFAVLPLTPPLLVGRYGELSRIVNSPGHDQLEAIITVPRPRTSGVIPLGDGAVLTITDEALLRLDQSGSHALELDASGQELLLGVSRLEPSSASRLVTLSLGDDAALVAFMSRILVVRGLSVTTIEVGSDLGIPDSVEIFGLARVTDGWIALGHKGHVLSSLGGGPIRLLGSLSGLNGPGVAHPVGAFSGADGLARLVDYQRHIACSDGRLITICGDLFDVRQRRVHALDDGLIVQSQSIDTHLVTEAGTTEIAEIYGHFRTSFAGSSQEIVALMGNAIHRLGLGGWELLGGMPDGLMAQSIAVETDSTILVGAEGGVVLTFEP